MFDIYCSIYAYDFYLLVLVIAQYFGYGSALSRAKEGEDSPSSSSGTCLYGDRLVNKSSRNGTRRVTQDHPSWVAATRKTGMDASTDKALAAAPSPLNARCSPS
jgi:hypothetical protein